MYITMIFQSILPKPSTLTPFHHYTYNKLAGLLAHNKSSGHYCRNRNYFVSACKQPDTNNWPTKTALRWVLINERKVKNNWYKTTLHLTHIYIREAWFLLWLQFIQSFSIELTREWSDPTCRNLPRFFFFSLQEYTQQNPMSKFIASIF
jgi:hypothetical protein